MSSLVSALDTTLLCWEGLNCTIFCPILKQKLCLSTNPNHLLPFKSTGNLVMGHFFLYFLFSAPSPFSRSTNKNFISLKEKGNSTHHICPFSKGKELWNYLAIILLPRLKNFPAGCDNQNLLHQSAWFYKITGPCF